MPQKLRLNRIAQHSLERNISHLPDLYKSFSIKNRHNLKKNRIKISNGIGMIGHRIDGINGMARDETGG